MTSSYPPGQYYLPPQTPPPGAPGYGPPPTSRRRRDAKALLGGFAAGVLAGGLVFGGDGAGNLVAHDAATGKPLWNTRIGYVTNPPQTYMLDGHQYLIAATGDRIWSFLLY